MYDPTDTRGVPTSRGLPAVVQFAVAIGVVIIFAVGAFVIYESGAGHMWPSTHTLRIPLHQAK